MEIRFVGSDAQVKAVANALRIQHHSCRFTYDVEVRGVKKCHIKIKEVRLREKKPYCGNHPNGCEVGGGPSRMGTYLEGVDWVSFNDMINDILDFLGVDANVKTSVVELRRGTKRRTYYASHQVGWQYQWDQLGEDSDYEDWNRIPSAPSSGYPDGTPGTYTRDFYGEVQKVM